MTVEHVAAAIMHGTTPEQEATAKEKPRRKFEDVESAKEKQDKVLAWIEKNLPKSLVGPAGEFKVKGFSRLFRYRVKTYVYCKLLDTDGNEPFNTIPEEHMEKYEERLNEVEANKVIAESGHKFILCLDDKYWHKKGKKAAKPAAPKAETKADAKAAPSEKTEATKPAKAAKKTAKVTPEF